jgi:hypothetical protein
MGKTPSSAKIKNAGEPKENSQRSQNKNPAGDRNPVSESPDHVGQSFRDWRGTAGNLSPDLSLHLFQLSSSWGD